MWSIDFSVPDSIRYRAPFSGLAILDRYSRECPAIEVDTWLAGVRMVAVLDRLAGIR